MPTSPDQKAAKKLKEAQKKLAKQQEARRIGVSRGGDPTNSDRPTPGEKHAAQEVKAAQKQLKKISRTDSSKKEA